MMNSGGEPVTNWAPIVGRWDLSASDTITYLPPPESQRQPFGLCVSNVRFAEGESSVTVSFPDEKGIATKGVGQLLFGYRSPNDEYLTVGLGGYGAAYVVSLFDVHGWQQTAIAGSQENLLPNHPYKLVARVAGQRVTLEVDAVRVLEHVLTTPLLPGQLGLFAWGECRTEFRNTSVVTQPGKLFIIMEFSDRYEQI